MYLFIHAMFIRTISRTKVIEKNLLTFSIEPFVEGFDKVELVAFIFSENLSLFPALTGEPHKLKRTCFSKQKFFLFFESFFIYLKSKNPVLINSVN